MLWFLLQCTSHLFTGVSLDFLWTSWIFNHAVRTFLPVRWNATLFTGTLSIRSILMGILRAIDIACSVILATLTSTSFAGNARLPAYPLAVKSPYLSTWVPGNQLLSGAATAQPQFWTGSELTWPIFARVDNTTYALFGNPKGLFNATNAQTNSVSYTSSHTYISVTAGRASFTLDFFSPVLPGKDEYARQSLPYSYLTVSATSYSFLPPKVEVLTAIDYTWTAQNGASLLNYTTSGSAGFFWWYNPNATAYTEVSDMATWGSVLFGTTTGEGMKAACGSPDDLYSTFTNGTLRASNTSLSCSPTALAGLFKDLGTCGHTASSATFIVGYDRVQAIQYLGKPQTGFYRTKWPTVQEAVEYVLESYGSAFVSSLAFDADIRTRAEAISPTFGSKYADIVEASVRQTFGGMDLTVPADELSCCPPDAFLKEISSDGNLNTVDFIYQSWPIFINLNPEYLRMLFEPILSYLAMERFPHPYVIHDMGTHYPNATGHDDGREEHMPNYETSALFILLYAYQKLSNDMSYASHYKWLLHGYADWLVQHALYPEVQLISVDVIRPTANQTGLAIQSVIGLQAASFLLNDTTYSRYAADFVNRIYFGGLGLDGLSPETSTHFTYNYGKVATWNVLFPSFSDVILDLDTFPQSAWDLQSDWYLSQMQDLGLPFAGPVDDLHYTGQRFDWGLTDWNIVAAATSSEAVQEAVVDSTHAFMTDGQNSIPFGTKYIVRGPRTGLWIGNKNRASVGSHFALMAKEGTWYSSLR